jgi:DNA-binding IclR family transcriptional regulator
VGESLPVNRGAAPRLLLAHLGAEERARRLARPLGAATAHTLTVPAALEADGALIRERGWAVAVDDIVEGVSALAAPVRDARGRVAAAVSVSGLTPQLIGQDGQPLTDALTRVRTAAAEISRQLQDMHWAR